MFPKYHFHEPHNVGSRDTNLFDSWGRSGGIYVSNPDDSTAVGYDIDDPRSITYAQYRGRSTGPSLKAYTAALPLLAPGKVPDVDHDPCMSEILVRKKCLQRLHKYIVGSRAKSKNPERRAEIRAIRRRLRELEIKQKDGDGVVQEKVDDSDSSDKDTEKAVENAGATSEDDEDEEPLSARLAKAKGFQSSNPKKVIPDWLHNVLTSKVKNFMEEPPFVPLYNSSFTGGCVSCLDMQGGSGAPDRTLILHAAGTNMDRLNIHAVEQGVDRGSVKTSLLHQQSLPARILQVDGASIHDSYTCSTRTDCNTCWQVYSSRDSLDISVSSTTYDYKPTSIATSPYIEGESLVSLDNGDVYL